MYLCKKGRTKKKNEKKGEKSAQAVAAEGKGKTQNHAELLFHVYRRVKGREGGRDVRQAMHHSSVRGTASSAHLNRNHQPNMGALYIHTYSRALLLLLIPCLFFPLLDLLFGSGCCWGSYNLNSVVFLFCFFLTTHLPPSLPPLFLRVQIKPGKMNSSKWVKHG